MCPFQSVNGRRRKNLLKAKHSRPAPAVPYAAFLSSAADESAVAVGSLEWPWSRPGGTMISNSCFQNAGYLRTSREMTENGRQPYMMSTKGPHFLNVHGSQCKPPKHKFVGIVLTNLILLWIYFTTSLCFDTK